MPDLIDEQAANSDYTLDRILSDFNGSTTTHSVGAATLSGGIYLPKTDQLIIPNPIGKKALPTMMFSIDGVNFYPQRYRVYNPGNPIPDGQLGAAAGMAVDAQNLYFYFTHYIGSQVDFTMFWTLDEID